MTRRFRITPESFLATSAFSMSRSLESISGFPFLLCCAACCSPPGSYSHTGELFGTLGAGWGPVAESMLPFIGGLSKAKTRPQSSQQGLVATEEQDDLFRQLLGRRACNSLRSPDVMEQGTDNFARDCNPGLVFSRLLSVRTAGSFRIEHPRLTGASPPKPEPSLHLAASISEEPHIQRPTALPVSS
jgi:hypothetical protein